MNMKPTKAYTVCSEIIGTPFSFDGIKMLIINTYVIDHETVHLCMFCLKLIHFGPCDIMIGQAAPLLI